MTTILSDLPASLISRIVASSCFDIPAVLDGVVVDLVGSTTVFDGDANFLWDLDGVVDVAAICALSLISSTLLHRCCKEEVESDVTLAKLLAKFRLVLPNVCTTFCEEVFGNVFGAEDRPRH